MSACDHCALRAPTLFSERMKSTSVRKTGLWVKQQQLGLVFVQAQLCNNGDAI